eukprot:4114116-Ditylum_brightwellii.AAC.2
MKSFLRENYLQAYLQMGDDNDDLDNDDLDNDDLDNELQKLSELERKLHDEKKCFVVLRQNDNISLQSGNVNCILIRVHNDEDSDTMPLEVNDLDDSKHMFSNIKKKLYSNSQNTASDDIMKIKYHSSSFNAHSKSDKSDDN